MMNTTTSANDEFKWGYEAARRFYEGEPTSAVLRIQRALSVLRAQIPQVPPVHHPMARFLTEIDQALTFITGEPHRQPPPTTTQVGALLDQLQQQVDAITEAAPEAFLIPAEATSPANLGCPGCDKAPSHWIELDWVTRTNEAYVDLHGQSETGLPVVVSQTNNSFETLAWACGDCGSIVQLPHDGLNVEWQ